MHLAHHPVRARRTATLPLGEAAGNEGDGRGEGEVQPTAGGQLAEIGLLRGRGRALNHSQIYRLGMQGAC